MVTKCQKRLMCERKQWKKIQRKQGKKLERSGLSCTEIHSHGSFNATWDFRNWLQLENLPLPLMRWKLNRTTEPNAHRLLWSFGWNVFRNHFNRQPRSMLTYVSNVPTSHMYRVLLFHLLADWRGLCMSTKKKAAQQEPTACNITTKCCIEDSILSWDVPLFPS